MIKILISKIFSLLSHVFTPKVFKKMRIYRNLLYTLWIGNQLDSFSLNSYISWPIYLLGGKYIKIGNCFNCDERLRLDAYGEFLGVGYSPKILIGDNVSIQKDCHIGAINKIIIGNNVLLASKVYISDHSHGEINSSSLKNAPALRPLHSKGPVVIEDNVWIGESVCILPNVTIGRNSIIGAGSIVTKSIPANSVVAGNPAKVIRSFSFES